MRPPPTAERVRSQEEHVIPEFLPGDGVRRPDIARHEGIPQGALARALQPGIPITGLTEQQYGRGQGHDGQCEHCRFFISGPSVCHVTHEGSLRLHAGQHLADPDR
jgi:hypothetical protein